MAENCTPPQDEPTYSHAYLDWDSLRKRSVLPGGFGVERVSIWPRLLHVKPLHLIPGSSAHPGDISTPALASVSDASERPSPPPSPATPPHRDEHQIKLDTERSFVFYPVGNMKQRHILQAQLHDLLVAVFRKRRLLSYFQGYHDITTVIFLTLPPPLHLPCMESLSLHRIRDSMGTGLEPVLGLLRILKNLLRLTDPGHASLLERASPLPYHALSNLLTLFAHDMPTLPLIQHVFDWLLCRPPIAVVYLAAAVILSRKEEVERLEEQGEEGMVHSLLSGLPEFGDGERNGEIGKGEVTEEEEEEPVIIEQTIGSTFRGEQEKADVEGIKLEPEENLPLYDDSPNDILNGTEDSAAIAPTPAHVLEPMTESELSLRDIGGSDTPASLAAQHESGLVPVSLHDGALAEQPQPQDAPPTKSTPDMASDLNSSPDPLTPTLTPTLTPSPLLSASPSPTPSTSTSGFLSDSDSDSDPFPKRTEIPLSALLTRADDLYASYPPTHPSLHLSEIMGPQSVVFTWSESDYVGADGQGDELGDDEAESMVLHPELVVYPYIEEPSPSILSDEDQDEKHRRRNMKKLTPKRFETRTMVVGAVIVLGVSIGVAAVYGIRAGHGHGGTGGRGSWSWRKVGGQVGGVLVGASERIVEGFGL